MLNHSNIEYQLPAFILNTPPAGTCKPPAAHLLNLLLQLLHYLVATLTTKYYHSSAYLFHFTSSCRRRNVSQNYNIHGH